MGDWSDLPKEILGLILSHLTLLPDYVLFASVCSSWRSISIENRQNLPPQSPVLVIFDRKERFSNTLEFFSVSDRKIYHLNLPKINGNSFRCRGSSYGWLTMFDHNTNEVFLFNPFSRSNIQLPSLDGPEHYSFQYIKKTVLSANPTSSLDTYIVVAIAGYLSRLIFFKSGDERWTTLMYPRSPSEGCQDVTYHKEMFYAVQNNGVVGAYGMSPLQRVMEIAPPMEENEFLNNYYVLAESSGELFQVVWHFPAHEKKVCCTVGFEVFELDQSTRRWMEVTNVGDRVIFLGNYGCISLSGDDFLECRRNCIYFTSDGEYDDTGVCNLGDGSIELFCGSLPIGAPKSSTCWITPNPWWCIVWGKSATEKMVYPFLTDVLRASMMENLSSMFLCTVLS